MKGPARLARLGGSAEERTWHLEVPFKNGQGAFATIIHRNNSRLKIGLFSVLSSF